MKLLMYDKIIPCQMCDCLTEHGTGDDGEMGIRCGCREVYSNKENFYKAINEWNLIQLRAAYEELVGTGQETSSQIQAPFPCECEKV